MRPLAEIFGVRRVDGDVRRWPWNELIAPLDGHPSVDPPDVDRHCPSSTTTWWSRRRRLRRQTPSAPADLRGPRVRRRSAGRRVSSASPPHRPALARLHPPVQPPRAGASTCSGGPCSARAGRACCAECCVDPQTTATTAAAAAAPGVQRALEILRRRPLRAPPGLLLRLTPPGSSCGATTPAPNGSPPGPSPTGGCRPLAAPWGRRACAAPAWPTLRAAAGLRSSAPPAATTAASTPSGSKPLRRLRRGPAPRHHLGMGRCVATPECGSRPASSGPGVLRGCVPRHVVSSRPTAACGVSWVPTSAGDGRCLGGAARWAAGWPGVLQQPASTRSTTRPTRRVRQRSSPQGRRQASPAPAQAAAAAQALPRRASTCRGDRCANLASQRHRQHRAALRWALTLECAVRRRVHGRVRRGGVPPGCAAGFTCCGTGCVNAQTGAPTAWRLAAWSAPRARCAWAAAGRPGCGGASQ